MQFAGIKIKNLDVEATMGSWIEHRSHPFCSRGDRKISSQSIDDYANVRARERDPSHLHPLMVAFSSLGVCANRIQFPSTGSVPWKGFLLMTALIEEPEYKS